MFFISELSGVECSSDMINFWCLSNTKKKLAIYCCDWSPLRCLALSWLWCSSFASDGMQLDLSTVHCPLDNLAYSDLEQSTLLFVPVFYRRKPAPTWAAHTLTVIHLNAAKEYLHWPRADHDLTANWPRADRKLTARWQCAERELTANWRRTDRKLTASWPQTDSEMTVRWTRADREITVSVGIPQMHSS